MSLIKNAKKSKESNKQVNMDHVTEDSCWQGVFWRAGGVVCWAHDRVGEGVSDAVKMLEDLSLFPKRSESR